MNNHPGGTEQVGSAALAQGGVRGGSFSSFQVLGRSSTSSHGIGFLVDYNFYCRIGHVQGNFDLKTMITRVRSGPLSPSPARDQALLVKRGLSSSFDQNFLVILLVLHTSKRVRCHLDVSLQARSR